MSFLINTAHAATGSAGAATPGATWQPIIMLVVFGLIFYFMLIRPQSKRAKEHKAMMEGLQKGDEVATIGGILGRVVKIKDNFVVIALAEGVEISVQRHAISATLPKGTLGSIQNG